MTDPTAPPAVARPAGLLVAVAVVVLEGLVLLGLGGWLGIETVVAEPSNREVASGSAVYFLVFGVLVLLVAWALWRRRGWSHGAAVFLQLLALPIAWTMLRAGSWALALPVAVLAVLGGVALLRRDTRAALDRA